MYLRADFNAVRQGDLIFASLQFAIPAYGPEPLIVGQWVRLEDGDGNSCWGVVEELRPPLVRIRLNWGTWRSADAVRLSYHYRGSQGYRGYIFRHPTDNQSLSASGRLRSDHTLTSATSTPWSS
jgi:hypothetical protein